MKTRWSIVVPVIAAVMAVSVASLGRAGPTLEPKVIVGRWQIVQGPPTGIYRTFLIETGTGETFIICGAKDGPEYWCPVTQAKQRSPD
jgi:hypothetical protein